MRSETLLFLSLLPAWFRLCPAFVFFHSSTPLSSRSLLRSAPVESSSSSESEPEVFGAQFFGGAAEKESLFDAESDGLESAVLAQSAAREKAAAARAEAAAAGAEEDADGYRAYNRFLDLSNFPTARCADLGRRLQAAVDAATKKEKKEEASAASIYDTSMRWSSPFLETETGAFPLEALRNANVWFRDSVRVAVVAVAGDVGREDVSWSRVEWRARWSLSAVWPNPWAAHVVLHGTSALNLNDDGLVASQTDRPEDPRPLRLALGDQVFPKFWDLYHLLMTPAAQSLPLLPPKVPPPLLTSYQVRELPPHLSLRASLDDTGENPRSRRSAQALPPHAFAAIVRTTGPRPEPYETTAPLEVRIQKKKNGEGSTIDWSLPVPPSLAASSTLPLGDLPLEEGDRAENDPNDEDSTVCEEEGRTLKYIVAPRRRVATVNFGGSPQDEEVAMVRRKLYENVMKDKTYQPKLDQEGRPQFFFWQNNAKACWTELGLGMVVYDWRPKFVRGQEIGMELELEPQDL